MTPPASVHLELAAGLNQKLRGQGDTEANRIPYHI